MREDIKNSLDEELIKKMDGRLTSKKFNTKKVSEIKEEQVITPLNSAIKCGEVYTKDSKFTDIKAWLQSVNQEYKGKSGVERVFEECLALYKRKNHDYSNKGKSAFDKGYEKMGAKSLWLRLNDKFTRFESLLFAEDEAQVKDEKIEDTLLDLINYAAMGLAKLKGYDN